MDPVTIWLFCLASAYVVRYLAEEAWASARGRPSPHLTRRQTRHELAQRHRADTGTPTIGRAVTGRVAERIANPRDPGAFRRFLAQVWEDAWDDASEAHRTRRERKRRAQVGADADEEVVLDLHQCPGGCAPPNWLAGDLRLCPSCQKHHYEWPRNGSVPPGHCQDCGHTGIIAAAGCSCPNLDGECACAQYTSSMGRPPHEPAHQDDTRDHAVVICRTCMSAKRPTDFNGQCEECANLPQPETPDADYQPDPEPPPASETDRKDSSVSRNNDDFTAEEWRRQQAFSGDLEFAIAHGGSDEDVDRMLADHGHTHFAQQQHNPNRSSSMTQPATINGDTVSPLENLGYADACQQFNFAICIKLDTIANNLAGAGVGDGFVQIVRDAQSAAERYEISINRAKEVYARHVHHQAEVAGDADLADTLAGTYLARATV